jgi:pimeloyl-ACP methyl ester carboxylesterase
VSSVWDEMLGTDLAARVPRLQVPVYLFHGVHDRTCGYAQARAWYARLEAPLKAFYSFAGSAHSPLFEEPERALRFLREDVLAGKRDLADQD